MTPINNLITSQTSQTQFDILQPIAESHISFHRTNDKMIVDAFSCKYFDEKKLLSLFNPSYTTVRTVLVYSGSIYIAICTLR